MASWEEEAKKIEQFIAGDETIDNLKLNGVYHGIPLARRFFQHLGNQFLRQNLESLDITIHRSSESSELTKRLGTALGSTKLTSIGSLRISTWLQGEALILNGLRKSGLLVNDLHISFDCSSKRRVRYLTRYLIKTKDTLRHLTLPWGIRVQNHQQVSYLADALPQLRLESLKIANLGTPSVGEDPTFAIQLLHIMSDMSSLKRLSVFYGTLMADQTIATIFCQIVLPKLTNLKHLDIEGSFIYRRTDDMPRVSRNLSAAIKSHPSIDSLSIDWHTPLGGLIGMIPALQKCKSISLGVTHCPEESEDFDDVAEPRSTETEHLRQLIVEGFSNVETLALQLKSFLLDDDNEIAELGNWLKGCTFLQALTLWKYEWEHRREYHFPAPDEKKAMVELAKQCPSLTSLKTVDTNGRDTMQASYAELSVQLAMNRLQFEEFTSGRLPLSHLPALVARASQEESSEEEKLGNLDVLCRLLKEKMEIFVT